MHDGGIGGKLIGTGAISYASMLYFPSNNLEQISIFPESMITMFKGWPHPFCLAAVLLNMCHTHGCDQPRRLF